MIKNIIISYDTCLVRSERDYEQEIIWDKLNLYFNYMGLDANSFDLKKNYYKAVTSLSNAKADKENEVDIDIEDVFFKLFKKYKFKAKKKQIKELAILFQILTTEKLELNPSVQPLLDYAVEKDIKLFAVANGQWSEIKNELNALKIREMFEMIHCSGNMGLLKPNSFMLQGLVETYNFKKKETIYITADQKDEIDMAKSVGVKVAFLGDNPKKEVDVSGDAKAILDYIKK